MFSHPPTYFEAGWDRQVERFDAVWHAERTDVKLKVARHLTKRLVADVIPNIFDDIHADIFGVKMTVKRQRETLEPKPETREPKPETREPKPETLEPKPETREPKSEPGL
jgi:hypothetical protein